MLFPVRFADSTGFAQDFKGGESSSGGIVTQPVLGKETGGLSLYAASSVSIARIELDTGRVTAAPRAFTGGSVCPQKVPARSVSACRMKQSSVTPTPRRGTRPFRSAGWLRRMNNLGPFQIAHLCCSLQWSKFPCSYGGLTCEPSWGINLCERPRPVSDKD